MSIDSIELWHKRARPTPTDRDFQTQLGCHLEELVEMLECLHFDDPEFGTSSGKDTELFAQLLGLSQGLKDGTCRAKIVDRDGFLDSLADQIVTAVGTGHCAHMQTATAVQRVNESNWTKFDENGQPTFDANGKIMKPATYRAPNLEGLY